MSPRPRRPATDWHPGKRPNRADGNPAKPTLRERICNCLEIGDLIHTGLSIIVLTVLVIITAIAWLVGLLPW